MASRPSNIGVNAPEFPANLSWLNSKPLSLKKLKGQVVLIDFWTYSCVNCLRTLSHVQKWHKTYAEKGLVIIGVHTPEFAFESDARNVRQAVDDLGIGYPVVLDAKYEVWNLYANHWWPRKLLIDKSGKVVYDHIGEGDYAKTEEVIQRTLVAAGAKRMPKIAPDDGTTNGDVCLPITPETYLGYERGRYLNPNVDARQKKMYRDGRRARDDRPVLEGTWKVMGEYAESFGGSLRLPYMAGEVNVVMDPGTHDAVEVEVWRNGEPVPHAAAGDDVSFMQRASVVHVDAPRMYRLMNAPTHEEGVLELRVGEGARLYAFTFGGGCYSHFTV
ncbi:hypothetical protein A3C17_02835 [Candidatus Uhrbacteria bacterium RIFCSPHIGHO2_02_FULL_53_13]|uniref:Thioredoxin domain-containing protein n=1 Tax=Candidatus Uhrbacteria bacterium RIFCSPHIGHO2_02_FULL_53_13 TaxID=1802389 RepID=A0A1F7TZ54_9BACT|nr:MAG: hypothetical protein A3C17_02835 [Candidatus Uhrbacteria bacterium RIFCSPHIGHO2_02_FULL_53_13]